MIYFLIFVLMMLPSAIAWAANTHGQPDEARERGAWFADGFAPYIVSGGTPVVPGSGLTLAAFATAGYAEESSVAYYITQAAAAVTVTSAATSWLAIHRSTSGTPSGCGAGNWTRVTATHYLTCANATQPVDPTGGTVVTRVTVAVGNITALQNGYAATNPNPATRHTLTDPWLGAVCNGVTDDSGALARAATLPTHATVHLPNRRCVIDASVTFPRTINIIGQGVGSELYVTLDTLTDGIIVDNGAASGGGTLNDGLLWRSFSIVGPPSAARNCAVLRNVIRARLEKIHIVCGTAGTHYALWIQDFLIESVINVIISGSAHENPFGGVNYAVPANGVRATSVALGAGTFNANTFLLDLTSPAIGLLINAGSTDGNNLITGSFQGLATRAIDIQGGTLGQIRNAHLECGAVATGNGIRIQNHDRMTVGPDILVAACVASNVGLTLLNADNTTIDGYKGEDISIDSASANVVIRDVTTNAFAASTILDSSTTTIYQHPVKTSSTIIRRTGALGDGASIVLNGSAERWTSAGNLPEWGTIGAPTIAREATTVKHGTYSVGVTGGSATAYPFVGVIATAALAAQMDDLNLAFTAWVYIPTAGGNNIEVFTRLDVSGDVGLQTITTRDTWTRVSGVVLFDDQVDTTVHLHFRPTAGTTTFFVDAVSAMPSFTGAPVFYAEHAADRVGAGRLTIGATPTAFCNAGDIHIDTDETNDTNCITTNDNSLCLCIATDTWVQLNNN